MVPPLFIALEGIDGSGKGTQTERLTAWFHAAGHPVQATREPSTGPAGMLLRLALAHRLGHTVEGQYSPLDEATMALLFAADRMDHLAAEVLPWLDAGASVVCDRYILSSYAYQGLHVPLDWLRALNARARVPDLSVLIDVPVRVSMERMRGRGTVERYEQQETLSRVRANFHHVVSLLRAEGQHIAVVDGDAPPRSVHVAIVAEVAALAAPGHVS